MSADDSKSLIRPWKRKIRQALLWGGLIFLFSFTGVGNATAQTCVPPAGLVSWWSGEGNAHDIVGNNHGTPRNGATFAPGLVGQAFSFDGVDDWVEVPSSPTLNFGTSDFTVELWVNFRRTDREQVVIEKWSHRLGESPMGWTLTKLPGNGIRFSAHGGCCGFDAFIDTAPIEADTWYFVAVTGLDNAFTLYWNSIPYELARAGINLDTSVSLKLGHRCLSEDTPACDNVSGLYLDGLIDEVSIYNRALSAAEIQDIFNAGSAGKCQEPDNDGDGVSNDADKCPNSDLSATVVIDDCDSEVTNTVFPSGCTLADLLADCVDKAHKHRKFDHCVAKLTRTMKRISIITGQQKDALRSCAVQADLP